MCIVGGKALPRGVEDMVVVVRVGWGGESERGGPLIGQGLTPPAPPGVVGLPPGPEANKGSIVRALGRCF